MAAEIDKEQREQLRQLSIDADIKSDNVDRIIEMTSPGPPKRRFNIEISKLRQGSDRIYLYASVSGLITDVIVYFTRGRIFGEDVSDGSINIVIGVICAVIAAFAVFRNFLGENTARVIGEELKINDKSYFTCDIERISCKDSYVHVISGGKPILKLTKAHEGCDELIRWAREYEIPIESTGGPPPLRYQILAYACIFAVFAVFIILMILLLK